MAKRGIQPGEIRIGHWWAECCELDLRQIETPADLAEAHEASTRGWLYDGCWETREAALADILSRRCQCEACAPGWKKV
jgi:hypothetical protein